VKETLDFLVPNLLAGFLVGVLAWIPFVRDFLSISEGGSFLLGVGAAVLTGIVRRLLEREVEAPLPR
jgi:hypothetical protein